MSEDSEDRAVEPTRRARNPIEAIDRVLAAGMNWIDGREPQDLPEVELMKALWDLHGDIDPASCGDPECEPICSEPICCGISVEDKHAQLDAIAAEIEAAHQRSVEKDLDVLRRIREGRKL